MFHAPVSSMILREIIEEQAHKITLAHVELVREDLSTCKMIQKKLIVSESSEFFFEVTESASPQ